MNPYFEDDSAVIYCGDCREILQTLAPVDLVLTDPPYGIGYSAKRNSQNDFARRNRYADLPSRGNQWAKRRQYFTDDWDQAIDQSMFDSLLSVAPQAIIWGGNYYQTPRASCWLVWDKQIVPGMHLAHCELAYTTLPIAVRKFTHLWCGYSQQAGTRQVREHLTEKPIPLMRWCLGLAKDARTVIDPFMGSGTTLRAAKDCGVKSIGIEINEKYCEIAAQRLAQEVLPIW